MARSRKATPASSTPGWKVPRPRLTPEQENWQRRYRPPPCDHHGSRAEWRLEPDLCDEATVAFYCDFCGRIVFQPRDGGRTRE
jgi:hypothetical protein